MRLRRNGAFLWLAYFLATVLLSTQLRLRYMAAINGIDHYYFVVCKRYRKVVSLFGKGRIFSNMPHMAWNKFRCMDVTSMSHATILIFLSHRSLQKSWSPWSPSITTLISWPRVGWWSPAQSTCTSRPPKKSYGPRKAPAECMPSKRRKVNLLYHQLTLSAFSVRIALRKSLMILASHSGLCCLFPEHEFFCFLLGPKNLSNFLSIETFSASRSKIERKKPAQIPTSPVWKTSF